MSEDIFFRNGNENKKQKDIQFRNSLFVEHIDEEQLQKDPGALAFGDIVTEDKRIVFSPEKKKKKKKHRFIKAVICVILAVAVLLAGSTAGVFFYVTENFSASEFPENPYISSDELFRKEGAYNILLIGRDSEYQTSSLHMLTADTVNKTLKLTAFDGRIYVRSPETGHSTLSYTVNNCPPEFTAYTVEFNFGTDIDAYFSYDYSHIKEIINNAEGTELPPVTPEEAEKTAEEGYSIAPDTVNTANGEHALMYLRAGNKMSAEKGTAYLLNILRSAFLSRPDAFLASLHEILPDTPCSIEKTDILKGLLFSVNFAGSDIKVHTVPAENTWFEKNADGEKVIEIGFEANINYLNTFLAS